ncbi:MAG: hypothetical protein UX97_C0015G0004 [Candidatus Beckwithbacteria bacterium GW2011_GWA2_47_25]|nr:MAG: hypothetical protein UX97_C0015G0004 [Candidatus Beckwithbacteria bacterium GW2011_GWA2_47_25]
MNQALFIKLQEGRKRYQAERTKRRLVHEKELFDSGVNDIGKLGERELFLVGIALYWAEGFKHKDESGLGLATLDSKMAKFYVSWLEKCLNVRREDLLLRVTANIAYKNKVGEMERRWADILGVELNQFHKPFFQKTKQIKVYENADRYIGVVRIRVRRGLDQLRKMRGWMAGLAQARI